MLANWFFKDLIDPLGLFGLSAQAMFMLRFVVQWFASERRRRSYVPIAFWYFSLIGGLMTFVYAYLRQEPVFMLAQGLGITIYVRNLVLIYRRRYRFNQRRRLDRRLADGHPTPTEATIEETEEVAAGAPASR
jgi:lipid-A-disaccharide synthase-like uncharacterized protein